MSVKNMLYTINIFSGCLSSDPEYSTETCKKIDQVPNQEIFRRSTRENSICAYSTETSV